MHTDHLAGMAVFALLVSIAFAALGRRSPTRRIRNAAISFLLFIAFAVGVAWLLFPLSR